MSSFSVMTYIVLMTFIALAASVSLQPVARASSPQKCEVKPADVTCYPMCKNIIVVDPNVDDYGPILTKALYKAFKDACTLYLSAGTYPVKTPIKMSSGCLQGAGRFTTKIVAHNSAEDTKTDGILRIDYQDDVSISSISIDSTHCSMKRFCKYNVKIKHSTDVKLYYSAFDGAHRDGVYVYDSERVHIDGVFVGSAPHDCYAFGNSEDVTISRSMAAHCGRHGVYASKGSSKLRIEGSFAMNTGRSMKHGCGFRFYGSTGSECASISETRISGTAHAGVCASKVGKLFVTDSSISSIKADNCFRTTDIKDGLMVANVACAADRDDLFEKSKEFPKDVCTGIMDKDSNACCPAECKVCETAGCENRYNGRSCCPKSIAATYKDWMKKSCLFNKPPCVVGKSPTKSE